MKRWEIINHLITKNDYKNYLEIGSGDNENFNKIIINNKISVDPNPNSKAIFKLTSDDFFKQNNTFFDIIFIDGLHLYNQAKNDLVNSLKIINTNGIVVMHDCNPTTYEMQRVDTTISGEWTGDVWKVIVDLKSTRPDLNICVVDTDYGCGVIKFGSQELIQTNEELSYDVLNNNRKQLLKLISVDEFIKYN